MLAVAQKDNSKQKEIESKWLLPLRYSSLGCWQGLYRIYKDAVWCTSKTGLTEGCARDQVAAQGCPEECWSWRCLYLCGSPGRFTSGPELAQKDQEAFKTIRRSAVDQPGSQGYQGASTFPELYWSEQNHRSWSNKGKKWLATEENPWKVLWPHCHQLIGFIRYWKEHSRVNLSCSWMGSVSKRLSKS